MLTLRQTCARMSVSAGLSGLAELPSLTQEEQVRGWLEDTELGQRPDNFGCDCFQPDNVHYACTDVTVLQWFYYSPLVQSSPYSSPWPNEPKNKTTPPPPLKKDLYLLHDQGEGYKQPTSDMFRFRGLGGECEVPLSVKKEFWEFWQIVFSQGRA